MESMGRDSEGEGKKRSKRGKKQGRKELKFQLSREGEWGREQGEAAGRGCRRKYQF